MINSAGPTGQGSTYSNAAGVVPALAAGAATTSSHSTDGTAQMVWGNGSVDPTGVNVGSANYALKCTSCHNPHGAGTYRALRPTPSGITATAVAISDATTKTYTTTNYWQATDTNAPSFVANVSSWCSTCHTRYLAADATASGDGTYTYRHKSNGTTQGSPNCIQCHVAHGSNASVGTFSNMVKNPDGTAAAANDSRLLRIDNRGTCQMCHNR